ncbi:hypothetical protein [Pseudomonas citronellolis]|uniref:hypothetical protein n=1 Tax=Pseudomonas citronellolis TaxID=53408 RepID=UPI002FDA6428
MTAIKNSKVINLMSGFLDKTAPSIEIEYSRYLDGDILGKIIAKNLLTNILGYQASQLYIPVGRFGDAETKYSNPALTSYDVGDGYVETMNGRKTIEIKCARINVANRYKGHLNENWAFTNILKTPQKKDRKYDILIAIGIRSLGLESEYYWEHLASTISELNRYGEPVSIDSRPHEQDYLSLCDFYIIPFKEIKTNQFRRSFSSKRPDKLGAYLSQNGNRLRCAELWDRAISS